MNQTLDRFLRLIAGPFVGLLLIVGLSAGANLRSDTVAAWEKYTQSVIAQMQDRERPGGTFLWVSEDASRMAKVRRGEIMIVPAPGPNPRKVPGGLIHHWIGAAFLPGVDLNTLLDVTKDYDRYKDIYRPSVVGSKTIMRTDSVDKYSMRLVSKAFLLSTALDGEYRVTNFRLDDHRFYSVMRSTRLQEVEKYDEPDESRLPEGEGSGFVWRVMSLVRLEERDGGVYLEVEALALSRDIPGAVRIFVEPIVRRVSHNSVLTSIQQTEQAAIARCQTEANTTKTASLPSFTHRVVNKTR